jgi:hypothetical protein
MAPIWLSSILARLPPAIRISCYRTTKPAELVGLKNREPFDLRERDLVCGCDLGTWSSDLKRGHFCAGFEAPSPGRPTAPFPDLLSGETENLVL